MCRAWTARPEQRTLLSAIPRLGPPPTTQEGLFSVISQTVYKAGQCFSGLLRSLFTPSAKDLQTKLTRGTTFITHSSWEPDGTKSSWTTQPASDDGAVTILLTSEAPLNFPCRDASKKVKEGGRARLGSPTYPAWTRRHGSLTEPLWYTLKRMGRGLAEVSPQQQRTAYGKCPSYPS